MTDTVDSYRLLTDADSSLPLFLRHWWLDATCGSDQWGVSVVKKGDEIHAALPYLRKARAGFTILTQPNLTPFLGPWIRQTGAKSANELARQKDLMNSLIDSLPAHDHYQQSWSPTITNWLPFYWRGFRQSTGYTYVLEDIGDRDALWAGLRENIRREIRKAEGRFGLTIESEAEIGDFLRLNLATFARQTRQPGYSHSYVRGIDAACADRGCRKIIIARDSEGRAHAGAYLVWSEDTAYYLMGGANPALRNSGAASLCLWEAIRTASELKRQFDFEGSMIEPIERFFRSFGARQVPYSRVTRTPRRSLRLALALRSAWSAA